MIFITGGAWQGKRRHLRKLAAGRATLGNRRGGGCVLYAGPKTEEENASGGSGRRIRSETALERPVINPDFITL